MQTQLAGQYQIVSDDLVTLLIVSFEIFDCGMIWGQKGECREFLGTELDDAVRDYRDGVGTSGERIAQRLAQAPWNELACGAGDRVIEFLL